MNTNLLIQLLVNGLVVGTLYGVVAMSFVLIYKATPGRQLRARRIPADRRLGVLVAADQIPGAVLARHADDAGVHVRASASLIQIVILRPMIGEPIISVIMVTIGLSILFQAALKWIFGVLPAAVPARLRQPVGQPVRPARSRPSMS